MNGQVEYAYDVFLSYGQQDRDWVRDELCRRLDAAGVDYFDQPQFVLGRPKVQEVERAVSESRWTLLILSPSYLADGWGLFDRVLATHYGVEKGEWRAIPLIKEPCELPPSLGGLVSLDLQAADGRCWQRLVDHLLPPSVADNGDATSPPPSPNGAHSEGPGEGLRALTPLMRAPEVRDAVADDVRDTVIAINVDFRAACEQIDTLANYKELHDQLHDLQFLQECIVREAKRFLDDEDARDNLAGYEANLQVIVNCLQDIARRARFAPGETTWIQDLVQARAELHAAVEGVEASPSEAAGRLKKAIWLLNRVLDFQPSQINTRMNVAAGALRLPELVKTLRRVRDSLTGLKLDEEKLDQYKRGVSHLVRLNRGLTSLRNDHDQWQEVDCELRRIESSLGQDTQDLEWAWPRLKELTEPLCSQTDEQWAIQLKTDAETLEHAISAQVPAMTRRLFKVYRRKAGDRFYRVDKSMKSLCDDLRSVGEPLISALGMIA